MISGAIAVFLAAQAHAVVLPACVRKKGKTYDEPATMKALVACQEDKLEDASNEYRKTIHQNPPDSLVERWQDKQRVEMQNYLNRHPDRASLDGSAGHEGKPDPQAAGDINDLQSRLTKQAEGGKNGITPGMAEDITQFLKKQQGGVSPDMQELLDSAKKDGANLSEETMAKLRSAAQKAKGAGLELNVKPEIEEELLKKGEKGAPGVD